MIKGLHCKAEVLLMRSEATVGSRLLVLGGLTNSITPSADGIRSLRIMTDYYYYY